MASLAQSLLDAKKDFPTNLGTAELRKLGADILRQSLFSARLSNAEAVQALRDAIRAALERPDLASARLALKKIGEQLGYDPARGFPGEEGVPPAEPGGRLDLFSTDRLNFILQTQMQMARGAAKNIWGNAPDALDQFPAWELKRVAPVDVPRGYVRRGKGVLEPRPESAWDTPNGRWIAACNEAGDDEAAGIFSATGRMIARKDSDVWAALGAGAGGYDDALGNDYEPFAFNSGMGRVEVPRSEWIALGGSVDDLTPGQTEFGPAKVKLSRDRFDPDLLAGLLKKLESGEVKFRVQVELEK